MNNKNFLLIDEYPKTHKKRIKFQLIKFCANGNRGDPRSIKIFVKYGFIRLNLEKKWEITEKGVSFLNERSEKTALERFYEKIEKTDTCWIWKAHCNKKGYGMFHFLKEMSAHRFSYIAHKGEIPEGMCVFHTCDNLKCVNPEHLGISANRELSIIRMKKFENA
jgi:hypothetical protein